MIQISTSLIYFFHHFVCNILHSLITGMSFCLFTHGNGATVIQGADYAFVGLVVFVADDVGEICEKHVLIRDGLFALTMPK